MPFPFTHANGNICCSTRKGCCPNCEAKLAAEERPQHSAGEFSPLDPYKAGLDALRASETRAAAARTHSPAPRPTEMHLDANGVPDPYFHGLERLRSTNR